MFIRPYDDPYHIIGQGTIGLEILKDLPDVDAIIVPVGGGDLISGIALARLLDLVARMQANIIHIYHARNEWDLTINESRVELDLDMQSIDHFAKIANALKDAGYKIVLL
jgi:threonine dehydratase